MLRLIWSHPEFPTKEDIRDELRRSEPYKRSIGHGESMSNWWATANQSVTGFSRTALDVAW